MGCNYSIFDAMIYFFITERQHKLLLPRWNNLTEDISEKTTNDKTEKARNPGVLEYRITECKNDWLGKPKILTVERRSSKMNIEQSHWLSPYVSILQFCRIPNPPTVLLFNKTLHQRCPPVSPNPVSPNPVSQNPFSQNPVSNIRLL